MPKEKQLTWLNQCVSTSVDWLWPGHLAAGKLTLLDGDPGQGKSLLTLDLAARLSTGRPWPDGQPSPGPANIVLLAAEDSLTDTVLPRLGAAEADLSRIVVLNRKSASPHGADSWLILPDDCDLLEETVRETAARLVIVDPFLAFLSARVSNLSDQLVRQALDPLVRLAQKTGAIPLLNRHLTKTARGPRALYRGTGAIAVVGAARTAFLLARHPSDQDIRLFACTKTNLGPPPPTLAFRFHQDVRCDREGEAPAEPRTTGAVRLGGSLALPSAPPVPDMNVLALGAGLPTPPLPRPKVSPSIEWLGEAPFTADELVGPPPAEPQSSLREATDFLLDTLGPGGLPSETIFRAARASGISDRTLERAKAELKIDSVQLRENGRTAWYWRYRDEAKAKSLMQQLYEDCGGKPDDQEPKIDDRESIPDG